MLTWEELGRRPSDRVMSSASKANTATHPDIPTSNFFHGGRSAQYCYIRTLLESGLAQRPQRGTLPLIEPGLVPSASISYSPPAALSMRALLRKLDFNFKCMHPPHAKYGGSVCKTRSVSDWSVITAQGIALDYQCAPSSPLDAFPPANNLKIGIVSVQSKNPTSVVSILC